MSLTPNKERENMSKLRPSMLPKLAQCPCFESLPFAGEAAQRGTLMDVAARLLLETENEETAFAGLTHFEGKADEKEGVRWAVRMTRIFTEPYPVFSQEKDCQLPKLLELESGGTCDWNCPELRKTGDWKSGEVRGYSEQMAAYALANMAKYFVEDWTCYLFFMDKQIVVTEKFTYERARDIINGIISAVNDPEKTPSPCEYCNWCNSKSTCPTLNTMAKEHYELTSSPKTEVAPRAWFEAILADPLKLSHFLDCSKAAEEFIKEGKAKAMEYLSHDIEVPNYKKITTKPSRHVNSVTVGHHIQRLGFGAVLSVYGDMSEAKFREIWDLKIGEDPSLPFPEKDVFEKGGYSYIKRVASKK